MYDNAEPKIHIVGYLAHNVTDKFGRLLLVEGAPMTDNMIQKLKNRRIPFRLSEENVSNNVDTLNIRVVGILMELKKIKSVSMHVLSA